MGPPHSYCPRFLAPPLDTETKREYALAARNWTIRATAQFCWWQILTLAARVPVDRETQVGPFGPCVLTPVHATEIGQRLQRVSSYTVVRNQECPRDGSLNAPHPHQY